MRKQLRIFYHSFRKPYRRRRPLSLMRIVKAKRKKALQESRRRKTARLTQEAETKKKLSDRPNS